MSSIPKELCDMKAQKIVCTAVAVAMVASSGAWAKSQWRKAAKKGDAMAQCALGNDYYYGRGKREGRSAISR